MKTTILIVEDDTTVRELVRFVLERAEFQVLEAADAEHARSCLAKQAPGLILLDWMLPGVSGLDLASELKRNADTRDIPIILLTARGEEDDKVLGLERGADDYVTKPFSPRELVARIRAVLRRTDPPASGEVVSVNELRLDLASQRVTVDGQTLHLRPTEFRLLYLFMTHPGRIYSRAQLLDQVWGTDSAVTVRTVDVVVRRLREALAPSGYDRLVQTVYGAGYRLAAKD